MPESSLTSQAVIDLFLAVPESSRIDLAMKLARHRALQSATPGVSASIWTRIYTVAASLSLPGVTEDDLQQAVLWSDELETLLSEAQTLNL